MAAESKTTAIKFLGRQLQELSKNPLPRVVAGPVDEADITLWHGTITFPESHPQYPCVHTLPIHTTHRHTNMTKTATLVCANFSVCVQLVHGSPFFL
jgi:hypothetical protein